MRTLRFERAQYIGFREKLQSRVEANLKVVHRVDSPTGSAYPTLQSWHGLHKVSVRPPGQSWVTTEWALASYLTSHGRTQPAQGGEGLSIMPCTASNCCTSVVQRGPRVVPVTMLLAPTDKKCKVGIASSRKKEGNEPNFLNRVRVK